MKSKLRALPLAWFAAVGVAALAAALASAPVARGQTFMYWDLNGFTAGAGGTGGNAPSGTWSDTAVNWNASADGTGAPFLWIDNSVAVFSAGTNATGNYTVSVAAGSSLLASGMIFQEGTVVLGGNGTLSFSQPLPGVAPYINLAGHNVTLGSSVTLSSLFGLSFGGTGGTFSLNGTTNVVGTTSIDTVTLQLGLANRLSDASPVQVNATGTLDLANFNETVGGLAGTGKVLLGAGTLTVASVSDTTFSGTMTGPGAVVKSGSATLSLASPAGWTGGTTVNAGLLALGASNVFPDTASLVVNAGGAFSLGAFSDRLGTVTGAGTVTLGTGALELGDASSFAFDGVINGLGSLVKRGAGTLTLNGANTFLGSASVAAGTLHLGANNRLADTLDVEVAAGATLDVSGHSEVIDALTGTGTVILTGGQLGAGWGDGFFILGASLTGPGDFDKWGNGVVTMTGTFGPSGTFSVQEGSVILAGADRLADGSTLFVAPGAVFSLNGFTETIGSLAGLGTVGLGSGRLTVANGADATFSGPITGSGGLTKNGAGTLSLLGGSTYTGTTVVNAGKLRLFGADRLAYGTDAVVATGAAIDFIAAGEQLQQTFGSLTGGGDLTRENYWEYSPIRTIGLGADNSSFTFAGRLRNYLDYQKVGSGTMTLTGANDYSSSLSIFSGIVRAGADHTLSESEYAEHFIGLGTTLDLAGHSQTLHELTGLGTLDLGVGGVLTLDTVTGSRTYDFSGTITGFGTLTKTGPQRYTLRGPLTYSGPTHVAAGALRFAKAGTVDTDVAVDAGANFELLDVDVTIDQLTGAGGVNLGTGQLVTGSGGGDFTFGGALAGGAGSRFVKNGAGKLTLNGTAAPATLLINGNTLTLGANERIGDSTAVQVVSGATFDVAGFSESIGALTGNGAVPLGAGRLTVGVGAGDFTFGGTVTGTGEFAKFGGGALKLDGVLAQTGGVTILGGTLRLGADERIADENALTVEPEGALDLNGFDETVTKLTGTGAVKLPTSSALRAGLNDAAWTLAATLSGTGEFEKLGAGDVTFTGRATDALNLRVSGGRFLLSSSDRLNPHTNLSLLNGAKLDAGAFHQEFDLLAGNGVLRIGTGGHVLTGHGIFGGSLEGTGIFEKVGPGTTGFTTRHDFPGTLRVTEGQVSLMDSGTWTIGRVETAPGARLGLLSSNTLQAPLDHSGTLRGIGAVLSGAVKGTGTFEDRLTLAGSYAPGAVTGDAHVGSFGSDLVLAPTVTLFFDLGGLTRGTQFDGLDVAGQLTLGGTLLVKRSFGFSPSAGDEFQLFQAASITGAFTNFTLPALPHGLGWDTSQLAINGKLRVVSGYEAFARSFGLDPATNGAPLANPSGDGIANLLKYLLGGNPLLAQPGLLPVATTEIGAGGTVLVFAYDRDALAATTLSDAGVDYSSDLTTWTPAVDGVNGVTITVTPVDAIFEHIEVRIPISGNKGFARLRASL